MNETPSDRDHRRVRELLGREPRGAYQVVVRDADGDPVVLRNAPLLDDGTPMPTRYWLVGAAEVRRIGQLEASGGVDAAEAAVDPAELAAAHARYAAERDHALPADHTGPRPSGGVGGTAVGVKCLHAHWAWHLAGGDDPIGRWIAGRLAEPSDASEPSHPEAGENSAEATVTLGSTATVVRFGDVEFELPWGPANLTERWLADHDPPRPDALTNALGIVADHLDDLIRLHPDVVDVDRWILRGAQIGALASLEAGVTVAEGDHPIDRPTAEEVFRLVATAPARDRSYNPGLPSDSVETIVATSCIVQATMRRLHLDQVTLRVTHKAE